MNKAVRADIGDERDWAGGEGSWVGGEGRHGAGSWGEPVL